MPSHQINNKNISAASKKQQYNSNTNYVEVMYKTLRRQENQLKQRLASNLQAQNYLRNVMNLERKLAEQSYNHQTSSSLNNSGRMMRMMMMQSNNARGDFLGQKRATMYYPTTSATATTTTATTTNNNTNHNNNNMSTTTATTTTTTTTPNGKETKKISSQVRQEQEQHGFIHRAQVMTNHTGSTTASMTQHHQQQAPSSPPSTLPNYRYMRVPPSSPTTTSTSSTTTSTATTATTTATTSGIAMIPSRLTMPVKYDHFDVTITKPLTTDATTGHLSLTLNVKNKSNTDVRFCVTFTNAQGKSVCVWPIVSETFKDLCDFELLEGKKDVDIQLSTRLLPREYLEFEGDKPLTLSIILTSHTAMSSTISEVVHLQRQYHSMLRMRQQQQENGNVDDDEHQCNSCGRTAIIRKSLKTL